MFLGIPSPKCIEEHLRYREQIRFNQQVGFRLKIAAFRLSGTSASSLCILTLGQNAKEGRQLHSSNGKNAKGQAHASRQGALRYLPQSGIRDAEL